MTWVCKQCGTNNEDTDELCIVCDATKSGRRPHRARRSDAESGSKEPESFFGALPLTVISAILIGALLVANLLVGILYYEWTTWVLFAETAIFIACYFLSVILINRKTARFLFPMGSVVVLVLSTLTFTLVGKEAAVLFLSLVSANVLLSVYHFASGIQNGDFSDGGSGKSISLSALIIFGVFSLVLYFIGEDLLFVTQEWLTLVATGLLVIAALAGICAYAKVSELGNKSSSDVIQAARFGIFAITVATAVDFIVRELILGEDALIFSSGLFVLIAGVALALAVAEEFNRSEFTGVSVISNVLLALSSIGFVLATNLSLTRWAYPIQQIASGAVLFTAVLHLIASVENKILEKEGNPDSFVSLTTLLFAVINTVLFSILQEDYVGVAIAVYALIPLPAIRALFFNGPDAKSHRMANIVLVFVSIAALFYCNILTYSFLKSIYSRSVYALYWGLMLVALSLFADTYTRSKGFVSTFVGLAMLLASVVLTILFQEKYYRIGAFAAIPTIFAILFGLQGHRENDHPKMKKFSFVLIGAVLIFAIVLVIMLF